MFVNSFYLTYKFNTNNSSFDPLNYVPARSNLLPETCTIEKPAPKVIIHTYNCKTNMPSLRT